MGFAPCQEVGDRSLHITIPTVQTIAIHACRLMPHGYIAISTVGTFGIASAAYWWARLSASGNRAVLYVFRHLWLLLFADDYQFIAVGPDFVVTLLRAVVVLLVFRFMFKWKKMTGGPR